MSNKFKHLVGDLRKSWEEEEASRAKQLEERLRNHYSAVLEHMESQLQMALKLQDEADRQWMEDVEARNKQQVSACLLVHTCVNSICFFDLFLFSVFFSLCSFLCVLCSCPLRSVPCEPLRRSVAACTRLASQIT